MFPNYCRIICISCFHTSCCFCYRCKFLHNWPYLSESQWQVKIDMPRQIVIFTFLEARLPTALCNLATCHYTKCQPKLYIKSSPLYCNPEDRGSMFLQNTGFHIHNYMHVCCCKHPLFFVDFRLSASEFHMSYHHFSLYLVSQGWLAKQIWCKLKH